MQSFIGDATPPEEHEHEFIPVYVTFDCASAQEVILACCCGAVRIIPAREERSQMSVIYADVIDFLERRLQDLQTLMSSLEKVIKMLKEEAPP